MRALSARAADRALNTLKSIFLCGSHDVVDHLKESGRGRQKRVDDILRKAMHL